MFMDLKRKVSDSQRRATDKYIKNTFDDIKVRVPKGQKQVIQEHAESQGESVNGFINRSITQTIERDKNK